MNPLLQN